MSDVYDVNERMHKLRVKLYPNYLPGGEGTFIARTINEACCSSSTNSTFMAWSFVPLQASRQTVI
jgi:hypothetical protein